MVADVSSQNAGNVAEPFQRVDLKTAQELIAKGDVQLIDVREDYEHEATCDPIALPGSQAPTQ